MDKISASEETVKRCNTCGADKPLTEFSGCGITPDRLQPNCKPCHERRKQEGLAAAAAWRAKAGQHAEPVPAADTASQMPLPYPGFEEFPPLTSPFDERHISKVLANLATITLNESPNHPNRKGIEELISKHRLTAEMTDEQVEAKRLSDANPLNRLTQDERLCLIRDLPLGIVRKLFPYV